MKERAVRFTGKAVTISCSDRDRSDHFYVEILGAEHLPTDTFTCPWLKLGDLTLTLLPNATEPSPARFPQHAMPILWLEVDDLQQAFQYLKGENVPIFQPPDDDMTMMITDPDGNLIEIWQSDHSG